MFGFAGFNGRALTDDVMDVILTLATNTALGDGVAPDKNRTRDEFPYFGEPYTRAEQAGVAPARPGAKKKRRSSPGRERAGAHSDWIGHIDGVVGDRRTRRALAPESGIGRRSDAVIARASFGPDGSIDLPVGYRQWSHVGTRYKPDGISILDGLPLRVPEIMNAYVEPSAVAWFQKTGEWPDGSQIVKEMSAIQVGNRCNQTTRICNKSIGDGIFQANYVGLGMMVKDSMRFPMLPAIGAISASGISCRLITARQLRRRRNSASPAT